MANIYKCRPSTLFNIQDEYTAFCFDEACSFIIKKIEDGEEPTFKKKYTSFKDMYARYG